MPFTVPDNVRFRRLGEEAVLLDLASGSYFSLDKIGTAVWQALVDLGHLEPALRTLEGGFEVSPERLRRDVTTLLEELLTERLLKQEGEPR